MPLSEAKDEVTVKTLVAELKTIKLGRLKPLVKAAEYKNTASVQVALRVNVKAMVDKAPDPSI